jgi:hypothetical protein
MKGLKITQTTGLSEIVSDTNVASIKFAAPTVSGNTRDPLKITDVGYSTIVASVLTYTNATAIPTFIAGSNTLYEYGELTTSGSFYVIASNRAAGT